MNDASASARHELEAKVVARAWADEGFRQRLRTDPHAAVAEETGFSVPESIEIEVLEETPEKAFLVIPLNRVEISDEQLDVAAGDDYWSCDVTCR
jgi:hypothetical protein